MSSSAISCALRQRSDITNYTTTRPETRKLQQVCRQPVPECRQQAASQMRSRGMLPPVVTWLLQSVVRSATKLF